MNHNNHRHYFLGEGNQNTFVVFDLLQNPSLYTKTFLQKAHQILLETKRDDALILLPHHTDQEKQSLYISMIVLEPDRSLAAFCGNGARVVAAYLKKHYDNDYEQFFLIAYDGEHKLLYLNNEQFGVELGITTFNPLESQFVSKNNNLFIEKPQGIWCINYQHNNKNHRLYFTQTIEPHLICFSEISDQTLNQWGNDINTNYRTLFPKGINLNRVKILSDSAIEVTTYERGVNKITQSCGTGSTSSAFLSLLLGKVTSSPITAQNRGGNLEIQCGQKQKSATCGPATIQGPFSVINN